MYLKGFFRIDKLVFVFGSAWLFSLFAFSDFKNLHQLALQTMLKLNGAYNMSGETVELKKYELLITDDGFFRYRKYLVSGKQEYYSFKISRFSDLDYLGSNSLGTLTLHTQNEDVIVQTYNDPKGNIDSMAYQISFPVKEIEAEDLQTIRQNLLGIRRELQND